jgi:hypothetical protein
MAIVYTHTRLDSNKVFYVGIGKHLRRAFDKRARNKYWYNVVNKHGYRVDITHKDLCWEEACSIEKYLIAFYGRFDLKAGCLVNLTDGGEGTHNRSELSKVQQLETAKANGTYQAMCDRIRYYSSITDRRGINSWVRKEMYAYDGDGIFLNSYVTLSSFAKEVGADVGHVSIRVDSGRHVKGYYVFSKYMGEKLSSDQYSVSDLSVRGRSNTKKRPVVLIDNHTSEELFFETSKDASLFLGKEKAYISNRILRGSFYIDNYKIVLN